MKWYLGGRCVVQKSHVVQHAQKTAELTGGLGRVAVLKVGYSIFQRSGILGGHLITEKGHLGCSEDALRRVDENPVPLKLVEEIP
jgi:hypothetical protein